MFREKYIRDNDQIKPDKDFLDRLKSRIREEETLSDENVRKNAEDVRRNRIHSVWKAGAGWVVLSVCLAIFVVVGVMSEGVRFDKGVEVLKGDIDSVWDKGDGSSDGVYEQAVRLFQKSEAAIYQVSGFGEENAGPKYLEQDAVAQDALEEEQRDELVQNILADKYKPAQDTEEFQDVEYYIAVFEDGSACWFAIGDGEWIYIRQVTGIRSLAKL